ncbi:MAG: VCBS repeat-containing protein [Gammaproteobacteria bacterium]
MTMRFGGPRVLLVGSMVTALTGCGWGGGDDHATFGTPTSVVIADLNGDGVPDLALSTSIVADDGSNRTGFASVFLQSSSKRGTFQSPADNSAATGPSSIAVGDLTGSGAKDLVVANFNSASVSVLLQTAPGSGKYQAATAYSVGGAPNEVQLADVNGDGKLDVIVADNASTGRIVILPQDPANPGHFLAAITLATPNSASGVAVGDVNGDGKRDIVAATSDSSGNNGALIVFYQNPASPGAFLAPVTVPAGAQPITVKIADMNGDGVADLVAANFGAGTDGVGSAGVSVVLQNAMAPGTFLAPVTYAAQSGTTHLVVMDVDGDTLPDVVTANLGPSPSGSVSVLLQDATHPGTLKAAQSYAGFGQPLCVAVGDLDGDGRPDIAVADGETATLMLQTPTPGVFSTGVQID